MDFTDAERAIFQYHDGTAQVVADPQVIFRDLARGLKGKPLGGECGLIDTILRGDWVVAGEAAAVLFPAICSTFKMLPLQPDGTGTTEAMQFRVLREWLTFKDGLKKKQENSPG